MKTFKYRYYQNPNLEGHYQRAIELKANIETLAYLYSDVYARLYQEETKRQELFERICERYATTGDLPRLACENSRAIHHYPTMKEMKSYIISQAEERARELNENSAIYQTMKLTGRV